MRQHSIKTTYLVHKTLAQNESVNTLIPESNMYLLVNNTDAQYPYLVIKRTNITSERGNKDFIGDIVNFNINVYSDKYEEGANIADAVRLALEGWILQDESIRLENIQLTSASEDWSYDTCIQSMNFRAEVSNPIETT